jgi:DHA3 family tetracycline resistance protein-like MFS transporter
MIFAISQNFMMAAIGFWLISMFREVRGPFYDSWVNQNVSSKVRATVFSMCSQANALGQIAGGPILGLVATVISLRYSMALAGLILIPTLLLYIYSIKKHKIVTI